MKQILFIILLLGVWVGSAAQNAEKIKIIPEKIGDGLYDFYAENPNNFPVQLRLEFTEFDNMMTTSELPFITTLSPGRHKIILVKRVILDIPGSFKYKTDTRLGAYPANHDNDAVYQLPVGKKRNSMVVMPDFSKQGSPDKIAYQFSMNAGDTIFAARSGVICQIVKAEEVNGMRRGSNSVLVLHADNSFARYELFADNALHVALGDKVEAGQALGNAENNDGARVQFTVFCPNKRIDEILEKRIREPYEYVEPTFQFTKRKSGKVENGKAYQAE